MSVTIGGRIKMVTYKGNEIPFYWDPISSEWLSVSEHVHQFGRRTSPNGKFLRHVGGVTGKTAGKDLIFPGGTIYGVITWVSASSSVTPNCTLNLHAAASVVHSESWTTSTLNVSPFLLLTTQVRLSVEIGAGATTAPTNPIVLVGVRWRLP